MLVRAGAMDGGARRLGQRQAGEEPEPEGAGRWQVPHKKRGILE